MSSGSAANDSVIGRVSPVPVLTKNPAESIPTVKVALPPVAFQDRVPGIPGRNGSMNPDSEPVSSAMARVIVPWIGMAAVGSTETEVKPRLRRVSA